MVEKNGQGPRNAAKLTGRPKLPLVRLAISRSCFVWPELMSDFLGVPSPFPVILLSRKPPETGS